MATVGGFSEIRNDIEIGFEIDDTMCDNLANVEAMPREWYTLSDNKIIIEKGSKHLGGVIVQLNDAFFADPKAIETNYVIPLRMTNVKNADGILSGRPSSIATSPNRFVPSDWEVVPKDFILYGVKYINKWDAVYIRRGEDIFTINNIPYSPIIRRGEYREYDDLIKINTLSFNELEIPMDYKTLAGVNLNIKFKMTFTGDECVLSTMDTEYFLPPPNQNTRVSNITVSGGGRYVKDGDKKSWGNKDRDALYLEYAVSFTVNIGAQIPQNFRYNTTDTLALRDRSIKAEFFSPVLTP